MRLLALDVATVQLVFLPSYFLLAWTVFMVHFFRRKSAMSLGLRSQADHAPLYDFRLVGSLTLPMSAVLWALLASVRGFEGPFCLSQLNLSSPNLRVAFAILAAFWFNWALVAAYNARTTQPAMGEAAVMSLWLV